MMIGLIEKIDERTLNKLKIKEGYKARYFNDSRKGDTESIIIHEPGIKDNMIYLTDNNTTVIIQYAGKKTICTLKKEFLKSRFYRDLINGSKNALTGFHEAISKKNMSKVSYGLNIELKNEYTQISKGEYLIEKGKGLLITVK